MEFAFGENVDGKEIRRIRTQLSLTRFEFAELVGVSAKTVEGWEYGSRPVTGPIVPLVRLLTENPGIVEQYEIPPLEYPMRLSYYHKNDLCSIIDFDESNQRVRVKNYTNRVQYQALGNISVPSIQDVNEFLKSRCFPETRDKMKLILKDLNLPFYDPLLIVEKTKGKMAEDDFWVEVERKHG